MSCSHIVNHLEISALSLSISFSSHPALPHMSLTFLCFTDFYSLLFYNFLPFFSSLLKKLLSDASRAYEPKDCPKGLEVLLTWRHPRASNGLKDILEIRIGGTLYSSLGKEMRESVGK